LHLYKQCIAYLEQQQTSRMHNHVV